MKKENIDKIKRKIIKNIWGREKGKLELPDLEKAIKLGFKEGKSQQKKEDIKTLLNYLDCDWRDYSKETQQVVKDIQTKVKQLESK